jgi:cardiolipin-specific phospholipase
VKAIVGLQITLYHRLSSAVNISYHSKTPALYLSKTLYLRLPRIASTARISPHATMASASASSDDVSSRSQPIAPQAPTAQGRAYFPLGYKEAVNQWWQGYSPAATEHRVLSFVPYLQSPPTHTQTGSAPASVAGSSTDLSHDGGKAEPVTSNSITDAYGPRMWTSKLVQLPGKDRALNEFSVERVGEDVENNLVILHGYGAGLGFFYKNFEALSRVPGWRLYALDLLGMGRSSRPTFKIHAKDRQGKITEAENWFIDALEDWRVERKLERFTLIGHSLGGYMAVAYALKYPGRLNKLILASPVGIPEDPYAVSAEMPEPQDSTLQNEFTQDQDSTVSGKPPADGNKVSKDGTSTPRKPLPKWLTYLWDQNVSPFSIVRWAGPLGPKLVSGWTSRRFSELPPEEAQALHDYSYSLFRQRGSGEYALAYILAPGAFARSPLIRRVQGLGRQYLGIHAGPIPDAEPNSAVTERPRENGLPVVLMYGDRDWMDVAGGFAAEQKLHDEREKALEGKNKQERERDQGDAKVTIIRNAGHHVYLDGWKQFNEEVLDEMHDVENRERARASWK